jgi:hypothetical protein
MFSSDPSGLYIGITWNVYVSRSSFQSGLPFVPSSFSTANSDSVPYGSFPWIRPCSQTASGPSPTVATYRSRPCSEVVTSVPTSASVATSTPNRDVRSIRSSSLMRSA